MNWWVRGLMVVGLVGRWSVGQWSVDLIKPLLDKGFKYEPYLCKCCYDLMQKAMNVNDIAIVSIKGNDYRIHFWHMNKDEAIELMKNSDLNEKNGLQRDLNPQPISS